MQDLALYNQKNWNLGTYKNPERCTIRWWEDFLVESKSRSHLILLQIPKNQHKKLREQQWRLRFTSRLREWDGGWRWATLVVIFPYITSRAKILGFVVKYLPHHGLRVLCADDHLKSATQRPSPRHGLPSLWCSTAQNLKYINLNSSKNLDVTQWLIYFITNANMGVHDDVINPIKSLKHF